jgi:FtsZ-interacting cell division protein ZipA
MNWPLIIIIAVLLLALIIFLVWRNIKDEKVVEDQLDNEYSKRNKEKADGSTDETIK